MNNDIQKAKDEWFAANAPFGKELGYPSCCINEFCAQPPEVLKNTTPQKIDYLRYEAGCINGNFTGFIPCSYHAHLITNGKIKLESLIQNRNILFNEFPNY